MLARSAVGRRFCQPMALIRTGRVADDVADVDGDLVVEHRQVLGDGGPAAGQRWVPSRPELS